jgi:hypothetical protein
MARLNGCLLMARSPLLLYRGETSSLVQGFVGRDMRSGAIVGWLDHSGRGRPERRQELYRASDPVEAARRVNRALADKQHGLGYRTRDGQFGELAAVRTSSASRPRGPRSAVAMIRRSTEFDNRWSVRRDD